MGGFLILSHLLTSFADGAEAVVLCADFEALTTAAPNGGWSKRGAQKYKDPANFTRDTQQPHDGAASFRLHHLAHTEGYLKRSRPRASTTSWWGTTTLFPNVQRSTFEDVVLTGNYQILDEILQTNALLRLYSPGRDVYQYDTEWGLHSSGPQGERADYVRRNASIWGMMHRAVRLIHHLREDLLRGASSREMFTYQASPGFGFLAQDAPSSVGQRGVSRRRCGAPSKTRRISILAVDYGLLHPGGIAQGETAARKGCRKKRLTPSPRCGHGVGTPSTHGG